jgi:hypothetical protein
MAPKKNKRKEKILESIMESPKHIDFHFSFEANGDAHSLIILLNGLKRRKGGNQALEHLVVDKSFEKWEEVPKCVQGASSFCGCLPCVCGPTRGSHSTKLGNSQVDESHCGRFGCHQQCPKWGLCQGNHQSKVANLLCKERDQNQTSVVVVALSKNIYGNKTPQN